MMRLVLLALLVSSSGCQRDQTGPAQGAPPHTDSGRAAVAVPAATPVSGRTGAWQSTPLGRDLERICNVVEYAGVADRPNDEQLMATLEWLPRNIESDAGRDFLVSIANLDGNAKADALDAGARRVGLKDCPIAQRWRQ